MNIIFASQNPNKIREINSILEGKINIVGLDPLLFKNELPETGNTLEANALQKARFVFAATGNACFADDTGLEIESLNGRPGVFSARYAGEEKNADRNMEKILEELANIKNRSAQFRTVIAYLNGTEEKLFEGIVKGEIANMKVGSNGFGYDPIFIPEGQSKSFAEMDLEKKNTISHRARAFQKFKLFLLSGNI